MQKKVKDSSAPKRPMSAYMLWLNSSRDRIKAENPGISVTEILKKAGEMWKQLNKDKKEVIYAFVPTTFTAPVFVMWLHFCACACVLKDTDVDKRVLCSH